MKLKAKHTVSITENCYIPDKLLESTHCKILLDMGASKSFVPKTFYLTVHHSIPY